MNFNEDQLTAAVIERLSSTPDARFKRVMTSLVEHLHGFVKDVELTEAEWFGAIGFLTDTGHKCDDLRQEFILLSDTLGVSMLVDAINHRFPAGATPTTVFGPFHRAGAPVLPMWADIAAGTPGTLAYMHGRVLDVDGSPLEGVQLDVWQADGEQGLYDVQRPGAPVMGRGIFVTGPDGRYGFKTVRPTHYPIPSDGPVGVMLRKMARHPYRPAHIHAKLDKPGYRSLITHVFEAQDPYLSSDAVFGVKDALVTEFVPHAGGPTPDGGQSPQPFHSVEFDFRIATI